MQITMELNQGMQSISEALKVKTANELLHLMLSNNKPKAHFGRRSVILHNLPGFLASQKFRP